MPEPDGSAPKVASKTTVRQYFTAKRIAAADVEEGMVLWLQLPPQEATDPEKAWEGAAAADDEAGTFTAVPYLVTNKPLIRTPTKTVETKWS